jgi:hypothetical protein
MTPSFATLHRRAAPVIGAGLAAFALCGCMTPYEIREFDLRSDKAPWGAMFINLQAKGKWKEGPLKVYGSPYRLGFAPRVDAAPPADCALEIANLRIATLAGKTLFQSPRLTLDAGPARPNEPNWRAHSAHFHYVPLSKTYVTSGAVERVELPYETLRLTFHLVGGEACPETFREPIPYDLEIKTHVWKGESSPLPSV